MVKYVIRFFLLFAIAASCGREELTLDERVLGLQYFPLKAGLFRIYEVEETTFLLNTGCIENAITRTFYIKDVVIDSFENLEDGYSYRIGRHSRVRLSDDWTLDSVWSARLDRQMAILVENNIPFVKLSFPLEERRQWDGNRLNNRTEDIYELSSVNRPFSLSVGNLSFARTVTVVQEDFDDLIVFKDQKKEVYAEDVGLVYQERLVVEYDSENNACIGQGIRNTGKETRMYLTEYGNE